MATTQQLFKQIAREPTVHFFLIAMLLFAAYAIRQSGTTDVLEIEQSDIDTRIQLQELNAGRPLTEAQRDYITAAYIEEQILVREALAMNLDDDARIHDILAQKMRHVLSGGIIQPTPAELEQFYNDNISNYQTEATVSSDELVFDSVEPLPEAVITLLQSGAAAEALLALAAGSVAPLPLVNRTDLSNIFDSEFADRVFTANSGDWVGPYVSNRGQHWLRVTATAPAHTPPLNDITDRVRLDWISAEEDNRLQQEVDKLWDRYTILINAARD